MRDLTSQLSRFAAALATSPRVVLGGSSRSGKTTVFAASVTDRPIVHTDDWLDGGRYHDPDLDWDGIARDIVRRTPAGPVLVEGVRATGVLSAGLVADCLVWLPTPLVPLSYRQEVQRKGRETRFAEYRGSRPAHRVIVIE